MPHARRSPALTLALGGVLALVGGHPAQGAALRLQGAVEPEGAGAQIRGRALADLRARRAVAAAVGFEALWSTEGQAGDLERAAEARAAAGHLAHAIAHWQMLLSQEPGVSSTKRADVARRMAAAQRKVASLPLTVTGEGGPVADGTVTLQWVAPGESRPAIVLAMGEPRTLALDPGVWSIVARAPGHRDVQQVLTVAPRDTSELRLVLTAMPPVVVAVREPGPAPVVEAAAPALKPVVAKADPRLGLGLGLGVAGAASLGIGMGLLIQHREGYAHFEPAPNNARFVAALTGSTAGASLVGAGAGLAVAAVSAGFAVEDRWLWTEVAVGGGVALVGAAWYAREWQRVQRDLYDGYQDSAGGIDMGGAPNGHDVSSQRRETASAAVLGMGAGLIVGAGTALLTRLLVRMHGGRKHSGRLSAGSLGVMGVALQGRF